MSELDATENPTNIPPVSAPAVVVPSQPAPGKGVACPTCGGGVGFLSPPSFVYAIGRIEARSPCFP